VIWLSLKVKAASAEAAVASGLLASSTRREVRSDHHADGGFVTCALDEIAFPEARHGEISHLWGPVMDADQRPCRSVGVKLAKGPGTGAAGLAGSVSSAQSVRTRYRIARQLAAECAGAAAQSSSDGPQAHALQPHGRERRALVSLHLLESSGHLHNLPDGEGVALQI